MDFAASHLSYRPVFSFCGQYSRVLTENLRIDGALEPELTEAFKARMRRHLLGKFDNLYVNKQNEDQKTNYRAY